MPLFGELRCKNAIDNNNIEALQYQFHTVISNNSKTFLLYAFENSNDTITTETIATLIDVLQKDLKAADFSKLVVEITSASFLTSPLLPFIKPKTTPGLSVKNLQLLIEKIKGEPETLTLIFKNLITCMNQWQQLVAKHTDGTDGAKQIIHNVRDCLIALGNVIMKKNLYIDYYENAIDSCHQNLDVFTPLSPAEFNNFDCFSSGLMEGFGIIECNQRKLTQKEFFNLKKNEFDRYKSFDKIYLAEALNVLDSLDDQDCIKYLLDIYKVENFQNHPNKEKIEQRFRDAIINSETNVIVALFFKVPELKTHFIGGNISDVRYKKKVVKTRLALIYKILGEAEFEKLFNQEYKDTTGKDQLMKICHEYPESLFEQLAKKNDMKREVPEKNSNPVANTPETNNNNETEKDQKLEKLEKENAKLSEQLLDMQKQLAKLTQKVEDQEYALFTPLPVATTDSTTNSNTSLAVFFPPVPDAEVDISEANKEPVAEANF